MVLKRHEINARVSLSSEFSFASFDKTIPIGPNKFILHFTACEPKGHVID